MVTQAQVQVTDEAKQCSTDEQVLSTADLLDSQQHAPIRLRTGWQRSTHPTLFFSALETNKRIPGLGMSKNCFLDEDIFYLLYQMTYLLVV